MTPGFQFKNDFLALLTKLLKLCQQDSSIPQSEQNLIRWRDQIEGASPLDLLDQAQSLEQSVHFYLSELKKTPSSTQEFNKVKALELEASRIFDLLRDMTRDPESKNASPTCYLGSDEIRDGY